MNVKRYFAPTARDALRALKAELGADAIVLSNRAVEGGVEILALPADEVGSLQTATRPKTPSATQPAPAQRPPASALGRGTEPSLGAGLAVQRPPFAAPAAPVAPVGLGAASRPSSRFAAEEEDDEDESLDYRVSLNRAAPRTAQQPMIRPFEPRRIDTPKPVPPVASAWPEDERSLPSGGRERVPVEPPRPVRKRNVASETQVAVRAAELAARRSEEERRVRELEETNARLMAELGGIRGMIERQLAGFAWGEIGRSAPERTRMMGQLLEVGFSAGLARRLTETVQTGMAPEEAHDCVRKALNRNLRVLASDTDIIDRGGVYALVGPTGVGKTTTTAKLAARCVVRHGASRVALITTDGYRIGAQEQLRIYGRILGVPVFTVKDASDLRQTLAELKNKHMVLIDTVGVSQRDRMVAEQAAMLTGAGNVHRLLLLNATVRGDTLDDVIRAYDGPDLAGCIVSKVDEAVSLAPAVDAAVRNELDIFYIANGQRVPEDLHLPNRPYLLHRALKEVPEDSPFRLEDEQAGLLMAAGGAGV